MTAAYDGRPGDPDDPSGPARPSGPGGPPGPDGPHEPDGSGDPTRPTGPDLVAGELRGYRQFALREDGLYPLVHAQGGPWDGGIERAHCTVHDHPAPAADCRCGLYGWYLPGSATVALGPASAVVAVRGRCILGDRGFRAAEGRVQAVSLPAAVRWNPPAARRARRMLAERYPSTTVYPSTRRMLKEHPPDDVSGLGIDPPTDHSRGYRTAACALWAGVLVPTYGLVVVPREDLTAVASVWWPVLLLVALAWQAGMIWLLTRLLALQAGHP